MSHAQKDNWHYAFDSTDTNRTDRGIEHPKRLAAEHRSADDITQFDDASQNLIEQKAVNRANKRASLEQHKQ